MTPKEASFVGVIITGGNANDTVFVQQAGIYITSGLTEDHCTGLTLLQEQSRQVHQRKTQSVRFHIK